MSLQGGVHTERLSCFALQAHGSIHDANKSKHEVVHSDLNLSAAVE